MIDTALATQPSTAEPRKLTRYQKALESIFGNKFVHTFASPYLVLEDQSIVCPVAVRFFKKDFPYLSRQLYLEYQYRSWRGFNAELLQRYADVTSTKLANIKILMTNNINRLRKLLESQGHKAELSLWPSVHKCDVPIIATLARTYMEVLAMLDQVYTLAGTANLMGVIDSAQRAEVEFVSKKAVRAFRSILQTEVVKLYREAQRLMREQQSAGIVDQNMSAIVAQQGQDIAAFDKSSKEDENTDEGMRLNGVDAGQLIDDAAAASTAAVAANGGTRKRTSKKAENGEAPAAAPAPAPVPVAAAAAS
jgi:hypothetical protein